MGLDAASSAGNSRADVRHGQGIRSGGRWSAIAPPVGSIPYVTLGREGWYNSVMESIYREVAALDELHRRSLEALLGHPLQGDERLYIAVLPASSSPAVEQKKQALEALQKLASQADASLQDQGITEEQWTSLVDEECEAVRHGKKS